MSEKHSPLPWRVFTNPDGTKLVGIGGQDGMGILDAGFGVWSWNDPEGIANAELVVRAVNERDGLLAEIERLREQLASARKALEFIRDGYERGDINHVDFRVGAYKAALDALTDDHGAGK